MRQYRGDCVPLNKSEEMDIHVDDLQNVKTEVVGFFSIPDSTSFNPI